MASEGLDIKSLTTLLMATPKADVCQSVGRILRVKHSNPLVIDIVDNHEIFEKQFLKRRAFYIKQKYQIISSNNINYFKNIWEKEYEPDVVLKEFKKKNELKKGSCFI